ncbi:hypothetical protein PSN45_003569 [Yamadazyma tenuis]|uniref:OPT-domain-containing protein n=1 Tax=Candida tenuis (strain ATCC 10573 / BCRC 21748 / CBS 615 / JCM 9827 / NBRC 10315 / NRRL Y-1498 / VKM Y-70) TaxID=590646 RepID=G3AXM8_CANTC|nr:OPT-domain-containing protein [Yamadazyma tenuis ATCC 10573]EGV65653.1 OPT-domain-containing protein [Yamadazyma tenuis ATCC 10573]WEJ96035.1 hypothetical protein PSN45_003569 [Yamadazyma tenuis]
MDSKNTDIHPVATISSNIDRMQPEAHQVDLQAVASHPISIGEVGTQLSSDQKFIILRRLGLEGLESLEDLPLSATFMIEKVEQLSEDEAVEILTEALETYDQDSNFPSDVYELIETLVSKAPTSKTAEKLDALFTKGHSVVEETAFSDSDSSLEANKVDLVHVFDLSFQLKLEASLIAYHSPYPEVRAVCESYDDPTLYCETPRVYLLGLIWTAIGSFINTFFHNRQPAIVLSASVVQIFLYPSGILLAAIVPKWKFKIWRYTFDLNPGPWNYKEQMLATIFYSVSGGTPYVVDNINVQKMEMFYNNQWANFGYQILLMLSTNFLGFGFAGIMRRFAVYPTKSIWPTVLPTCALNAALCRPEKKENINGWTISRYYFFLAAFSFSFVYYWLPEYLMQFLSTFNWITWIKPTNQTLAEITGSVGGLGFNPFPTFDWNILDYNAALTWPFYAQVNNYSGSVLAFFCICGVYYSNHLWTGYIPINSNGLFTNKGVSYDVKQIVNSNSLFDKEKYEEIGPPYYSAANLVLYGAFDALYPFAILYECILNHKQMWHSLKGLAGVLKNFRKSTYDGFHDPHTQMMRQYKEVPEWVFTCVLVISLVLAIICVEVYPAETPVWGIFFALAINFVFLIPLTAIYSTTGFQFGLNVLVELIIGYALPGNALALNFIKAFGFNINGQAQNYISDQKMAHYIKIPPRALFRCQVLSVILCSFVSLAVVNFQLNHIENYCSPSQAQRFTCPNSRTFYSASVLWGVIGPKKVFGGLYPILQWCFLIGALLPFPCLAFKKWGPRTVRKYFQPTLIIGGFMNFAPYNLSYFTSGVYLSFAFMYYIKKHYLSWWEKYTYILTAGLSAGVAFSSIIIFFAVQYHDKSISWWGNNVMYAGYDELITSVGRLNATVSAPDGYFGLRKGHYP